MGGILEISWFLDWAIKWGLGRTKRIDAAVEALGSALVETRIYLVSLSRGEERDYAREAQLVRLWNDASQMLERIDDETARLARMKSEYWLRPEAWERHGTSLREIEIHNVLEKYRHLKGEPSGGYHGIPG
jgi:hypothetical protein